MSSNEKVLRNQLIKCSEAMEKILSIARTEDCACGHEGCRETADAWFELELAQRGAARLVMWTEE